MSSRSKQMRELEALARELGWQRAGATANNHLRWVHRNGAVAVTGSDLANGSGWQNAVAQLRRGARRPEERRP